MGRRLMASITACLVAISLVTPAAAAPAIVPPAEDPFYVPPDGFESTAPGTILRKREVDISTYLIPTPVDAYQVLVRTNDSKNRPVAVVSTVLVPPTAPPANRTLLSYQVAIDSLGTQCNPSYQMRTGTQFDSTGLAAAVAKGWIVTFTDYQGPRMSWIAGPMAAHGVLDGIRASLALPEAGLDADSPVVAWGYSGGGHATAWAAQEQPSYAPELDVKGWAANAFTGDLRATLRGIDGGPAAGFALAGAIGLSREHEEVDLFNARGDRLVAEIGDDCLVELVAGNPFERVNTYTTVDIFTDPVVGRILTENSAGAVAPTAPVLVQQSRFDELVSPSYNAPTVAAWCAKGATVEYHLSAFPGHIAYAGASVPYAMSWLDGRVRGEATDGNCAT